MQGGAEARYVRDNILTIQSQVTLAQPYTVWGSSRWRSWLNHLRSSRKVADSIPDGVIGFFFY